MSVRIAIEDADVHVQNMFTRFPFQYGIASLTALPHLFLRLRVRVNGRTAEGLSAEGLPPKWFTKDPHTRFEEDLPDLIRVITQATVFAKAIGETASFFAFWQALYAEQARWARAENLAPLLANLGVSLVERAVLDAIGRGLGRPFHQLLRENVFGMELGEIHPELVGLQPRNILPARPLQQVIARHTIGLGDPLEQSETPLDDGLPHTLKACIESYGLRYFKIKLSGDLERDRERLTQLANLFKTTIGKDYHFTLDGNENYQTVDQFICHWNAYQESPALGRLMKHLLFVEQPLHRNVALSDEVAVALRGWENRPPLIIDESDSELGSLPKALALGYNGTSHKNCKGIIKGIANAALLVKRRQENPNQNFILSGEDLANVGPVALLQDLAVMASLGIPHVERNGHHYFKGLSAFPEDLQRMVTDSHADLYRWHDQGFATLAINAGTLSLQSVTTAGFGIGPWIDPTCFTPLHDWDPGSFQR